MRLGDCKFIGFPMVFTCESPVSHLNIDISWVANFQRHPNEQSMIAFHDDDDDDDDDDIMYIQRLCAPC